MPYYIKHDQKNAAEIALNFAKSAFVDKNFETAFQFVRSDTSLNRLTLGEFVESMHPDGVFPTTLKAVDYEIVPNSGIVIIYLQGPDKDGSPHYYRIGTVQVNGEYKITDLYHKDNGPFPSTPLRKPLD